MPDETTKILSRAEESAEDSLIALSPRQLGILGRAIARHGPRALRLEHSGEQLTRAGRLAKPANSVQLPAIPGFGIGALARTQGGREH